MAHGLFQNLTGMRFGRLIVADFLGRIGANNCWNCICECGERCAVSGGNLKSGHTKSCGCLHKEKTSEVSKTHGQSKTPEYRIWAGMKARCYNENTPNFSENPAR